MKRLTRVARQALLLLIALIIAVTPVLSSVPIQAAAPSLWVNGQEPIYTVVDEEPNVSSVFNFPTNEPCTKKAVQVEMVTIPPTVPPVYDKNNVETCGVRTKFGLLAKPMGQVPALMQFAWDQTAYKLTFDDTTFPFIAPQSNSVFRISSSGGWNYISIYDNPAASFERQPDTQTRYKYVPKGNPSRGLRNANNDLIGMKAFTTSENGEWLLAETGSGLTRINLTTLEMLTFPGNLPSYGQGQNPEVHLSISNDGRYAAASGVNVNNLWLYDLATCEAQNSSNYLQPTNGCGSRSLYSFMQSRIPGFRTSAGLRFSGDATDLNMIVITDVNGNTEHKKVAITAPGINNQQLDYLALGDSYSSGEGDTANGGHNYLPGTNGDGPPQAGVEIEKEKCHIHNQSFPYVLARNMNIPSGKFRSVACSSALMEDILNVNDEYPGNFEHLLSDARASTKQQALNDFVAGREAQIRFVEKYKPKVITISIGGNDVGFKEKLESCLEPGTCHYAGQAESKKMAATEIANLRGKLKDLYTEIYRVSPNSKLYVVGYPQFIKNPEVCTNINTLVNSVEREFMGQSVTYLNQIIRSAAVAVGAKYLDIEASFGEAALCGDEAEKAVTGLARGDDFTKEFVGDKIEVDFAQESFHPNPKGHQLIANNIISTIPNLLSHAPCDNPLATRCTSSMEPAPPIPDYFSPSTELPYIPVYDEFVDRKVVDKSTSRRLNLKLNNLQPGSTVKVEGHSVPTELASYTATAEGTLDVMVTIPQTFPAGHHTLHAYAVTPSGEQIDLYQELLVVGAFGDRDEDGVTDTVDPCPFVPPANADVDQDGIDDACDGMIGEPPAPVEIPLYRVRNGDPAKNEQTARIYIERNKSEAATKVGITNDFDPDGDGWALVGRTSSDSDNGTPANFWIEDKGETTGVARYVPHVSSRHQLKGCHQMTPISLAQVKQGETRLVKTEATNTNTCRKEPPQADTDADGTPDNTQTLYRARNGDASRGEVANRVYLERNRVAAEAQLGITDYDPDDDGWSNLSRSNGTGTDGQVKSLVIYQGIPHTLVLHPAKGCIALRPNGLNFVRQGETRIAIQTNVPTGTSCAVP